MPEGNRKNYLNLLNKLIARRRASADLGIIKNYLGVRPKPVPPYQINPSIDDPSYIETGFKFSAASDEGKGSRYGSVVSMEPTSAGPIEIVDFGQQPDKYSIGIVPVGGSALAISTTSNGNVRINRVDAGDPEFSLPQGVRLALIASDKGFTCVRLYPRGVARSPMQTLTSGDSRVPQKMRELYEKLRSVA
jgi:hypothetical protein